MVSVSQIAVMAATTVEMAETEVTDKMDGMVKKGILRRWKIMIPKSSMKVFAIRFLKLKILRIKYL